MIMRFWFSLIAFICTVSLINAKNNRVAVTLQTHWSQTSLVSEASEYVADEGLDNFWRFLDFLKPIVSAKSWQDKLKTSSSNELGLSAESYIELEDALIQTIVHPGDTNSTEVVHRQLFRLYTASRTYSPAVEMAHQMALTMASQLFNCSHNEATAFLSNCMTGTTWAQVGDRIVCKLDDLKMAVRARASHSIDFGSLPREKIFVPPGASSASNKPCIILYGALEQPDFYEWHSQAKSSAAEANCVYIFRHYMKIRPEGKVRLGGYGVELALKSTEYKAMDDTKVVDGGNSEEAANEATVDPVIQGFNFTHLTELHPDLTQQLKEFQQHLLATDDEIRPLKVWQFRELGLQASQAVINAFRLNAGGRSQTRESNDTATTVSNTLNAGLETLRDVSQNLPVRASRLLSLKVDPALREELATNQYVLSNLGVHPGQSLLSINGLLVSPSVDLFALLDLLRQESRLMMKLHELGIPANRISEILTSSSSADQSVSGNTHEPSVPGLKYSLSGKFALDLANAPVIYLNNLETDQAYSSWPESLHALFTLNTLGGIRRLRRNLYNIILVVDPAAENCRQIIRLVESLLIDKRSIRFGLLWSIDSTDEASLALVRAFTYIASTVTSERDAPLPPSVPNLGSPGAMSALSFLNEIYAQADKTGVQITASLVQRAFERLLPSAYVEDVFLANPGEGEYDFQLVKHAEFMQRSGLKAIGSTPLMLFNGLVFDATGIRQMGGFEDAVYTLCMEELIRVQNAVYHDEMSNKDTVFHLYQKSNCLVPRFNARVLSTRPADMKYVEVVGSNLPVVPAAKGSKESYHPNLLLNSMRYFQKGDLESAVRPVTIWVVLGDLDTIFLPAKDRSDHEQQQLVQDLNLARSALIHLRSAHASKGLRLGFVHNPASSLPVARTSQNPWLTRVLHLLRHPARMRSGEAPVKYAEQMAARNFGIRLITKALEALNASADYGAMETMLVSGIDGNALNAAVEALDRDKFMETHSSFCRHSLGLKPGQRAIVLNGRIFGPLNADEEFTTEDFRLVERLALDSGIQELGNTLDRLVGNELGGPEVVSELTWRVASLLRPRSESADPILSDTDSMEGIISRTRMRINGLAFKHSGFELPSQTNIPTFELLAVINPASRDAQRLSHIIAVIQQSLPNSLRVVLNPVVNLPELPVKNFYHLVWEPSPFHFAHQLGSRELLHADPVIPRALFNHLPGQPLLTLGMDAPHGWMVAAVEAVHDLDNLRLADVYSVVDAVFELEYLLVEGHCFEEGSMKPPRGLQLTLGPASDLNRHDTIVMANLGYFQLKAGPGAWHLRIRSGRSRDLYTMAEADNIRQVDANTTELIVVIDSFRSKIITMRVNKRPERAGESLLDETGARTTSSSPVTWNWLLKLSNYAENLCPTWLAELARSLQSKLPWQTCKRKEETINVFSLASGHLYERLLRIMMLTVLRHTESPVKFWFLKNYLSPTFKKFIPHMAAEYGFQYELVEYQWPRWLHSQTEKQRIIWGYKILFLDVLFPLNVTKIIYVDADQIVRSDLQELADLDLEGAPYGYTPFCDSRKEMDGFRFWKQGYWASHLNGRPYHISALYVVDLHRFRQLAAGDRLRGQYHGLSQDPNSLSNLDQDLPNNMIHQVPIKSLPQEWLWCETWCSDESKSHAKTIDLCNNPQTKEPKLSAAMRIAPEWVDYDREIKKLWQRVNQPASTTPMPKTPVVTPSVEGSSQKKPSPLAPPAPSSESDSAKCSADSSTCSADRQPVGIKPDVPGQSSVKEGPPETKPRSNAEESTAKEEL